MPAAYAPRAYTLNTPIIIPSLGAALAASPLSTYRGLVMAYAVEPAVTMPVRATSPVASAFSPAAWTSLSLLAASGLTGIE